MSVNKVILIGNLGRDPEVRFTSNGRAVARFSVATSEVWKDAEGNRQERTEWHNIVVWGKQGETCAQYLAKGRQVYVEGSIRNSSYDDKSGNKRYVTEIIAQRVRFLGGGGGTRLAPEAIFPSDHPW
jgi:single-strand DNA-binding protein